VTPPVRPKTHPAVYLQYLRETAPERAKQYEDYLKETGQAENIGIADRQQAFRSGRLQRDIGNRNDAEAFQQDVESSMAPSLMSALDAGTFGLAGLAVDALSPGDFTANRDARAQIYENMSGYDRTLSSLAGGLASPVRFLKPAGTGAGYLSIAGRGAAEGAMQGAATGFGENVGTSDGFGKALVGAGVGAAAGTVGGGVLSPLAARIVRGRSTPERDALFRALLAAEADKTTPTLPAPNYQTGRLWRPNIPQTPLTPVEYAPAGVDPIPMAIDEAGPMTTAYARGATGTVQGREALRVPFAQREAAMPRQLLTAFDEATGTTAADADALAREIADMESRRMLVNAQNRAQYDANLQALKSQHAQAVAAARAAQPPAKPQPVSTSQALSSLERQAGGPIPDAVTELQGAVATRRARADQNYATFIELTKGKPIDLSPEMEAFMKTPAGQAAWTFVQRSRLNELDPSLRLPTVERWNGPDLVDEAWPDAQAVHEMKRYLRNAARMQPGQTTPEGLSSIDAGRAAKLMDPVMETLDPIVRTADAAYAGDSRAVDAIATGMVPSRGNPPVKQAMKTSLTAREQQVGTMEPQNAEAFARSKQWELAQRLRGGMSPERAARMLEEPTSDLARTVRLAGLDPAALAAEWRTAAPQPFQRPVVPPFVAPPRPAEVPQDPTMVAALRGLDIRGTTPAPSAARPMQSLPVLEAEAPLMPPNQQTMLRRGASAAFRDDISSGNPLDLGTPTRARQFRFAAETPDAAQRMAEVEAGQQRVLKKQRQVLPSGVLGVTDQYNTMGATVADVAATSPSWAAVRAARHFMGRQSAGNLAERAAEDAAFGALMTGRPETLQDALSLALVKEQGAQRAASRMAGRSGRIAGSRQ
jgi:hypothetical protein